MSRERVVSVRLSEEEFAAVQAQGGPTAVLRRCAARPAPAEGGVPVGPSSGKAIFGAPGPASRIPELPPLRLSLPAPAPVMTLRAPLETGIGAHWVADYLVAAGRGRGLQVEVHSARSGWWLRAHYFVVRGDPAVVERFYADAREWVAAGRVPRSRMGARCASSSSSSRTLGCRSMSVRRSVGGCPMRACERCPG